MRKSVFIWLSLLFLQITVLKAQVSDMNFSYQAGTYSEISGGTVLGNTSTDDECFVDPTVPIGGTTYSGVGLPIGFTFHFNGYDFDKFAVNANGWISFGTSSLTPSVNIESGSYPLSSTTTFTPAYLRSRVAACARDLAAQPGSELSFLTTGSAPNRVLVVQWKNYGKYNATGDNYNFQIRLYETTNVVEYVYGTMTNNTTSATPQVGLGGTSSTNYSIRTTTTNWSATTAGTSNSATCTLSNTIFPASGTTFRWTPPSCPIPAQYTASNITSSSIQLNWVSSASEFQLEYGAPGFTIGTGTRINNINTPNYQITGLTPITNYQVYLRAVCGVGDTSNWISISFSTTQILATLPYSIDFESGTENWSILNGTATNKWTYGTATASSGTHSMYISNDNGITNAYTTSSSTVVHIYRDVTFPTTTNPFKLVFKWKGYGESASYDYLKVYMIPTSQTPVVGTQLSSTQLGTAYNLQNTWQTASIQLSDTLAGKTKRFVFSWYNDGSGGTQPPIAVDDIQIYELTCPPPSLVSNNLTSTSANISWTSSASEFQLEYGVPGFTIGTGTRINNINASNYNITGLTPTTNYQVYVRAICSVGDTSTWSNISFATTQILATLPYSIDFESGTENWSLLNGTATNKWTYGTATASSGTHSIYISDDNGLSNNYNTGSSSVVHIYRDVTFPTTTNPFKLVFKWKGYGESASYDYLKVYMIPTSQTPVVGTQLSSTQLGTVYNLQSTWQTASIQMSDTLAGKTKRFVFSWYNDGSGGTQPPIAVDDIQIYELTCPPPTNLLVSNITSTSANISWTAGGGESSWDVEYGPIGFAHGTGILIQNISTTTYNFTGLTPGTNYQVYVLSQCSSTDSSSWLGPVSFATTQISATLPYYIDFESGTEQWGILNGSATNKWLYGTATAYSGTHSMYISDDNGVSNAYNTSSTSIVHFYRDVTFPTTTNPIMLEFAWKGQGESSSYDYLKIYMIPTTQSPVVGTQLTSTQLGSTYNLQNSWQNASVQLPDTLSGKTKRFVFSWYNDVSGGTQPPAAVDDIRFYVLTCPKPTSLAANTILQNSANLTWTAGGSEGTWQLEWGNAGFSLGTGTLVNNLTSTSYNLTGLTASTSYSFYVRGICGAGDTSTWAGPYTFTTACGAMTAVYPQNFDAVTAPALPNCWSYIAMSSSGSPTVSTVSTGASTTPNCAQLFNSTASGSTTHILLVTPQFSDLPSHTTQITFKAKFSGTGTPVLYVGTMTDPTNPGTFSNFQAIMTLTSNWQEYTVAFNTYSGSNQYIAFKHGLGMTNQYIYIDDVSYELIPSCPKPTNLTVSNVTGTDASLAWTAGGSETSWDIEYGPTGFAHGTGTLIQNINTTSYNLTGLNPSTNYQAYVLAQCSGTDSSMWLGPVNFTTTQIPATLPYIWDFENDFNGWSVVNGTQTNKWYTGTATFASATKSAYISNTNGATNNYDVNTTSVSHIYRDIQFPAGAEFVMTFKWKAVGEGTSTMYDYMQVFLDNNSFIPVAGTLPTNNQIGKQYYNQNNVWKTDTIFFDNTVANSIKRLIFTWENDASLGTQPPIAIDDIDIRVVTCPKPVSLNATNQTSSSATLGWTEQGSATQWQVQYGTQGFTLGTGTSQLAFTNPVNITGLSSGSYYSFYVRSICGAGDTSYWAGPYIFYIPCDATTATYTQNFDGVTDPNLPLCWTKKVVSSSIYPYVETSTYSPNSSPNCVELYNSDAQGAATHILLISPPFSDLSNHLNRIRFNLKGDTDEKLVVGTMTDPANENTFTAMDTISIPDTWTQKIVSFLNYSGTNQFIAFKHATVSTYTSIYLDDFVYEPLPTTDLAVTQIVQPSDGCGLTANEPITIKVKNMASQSYSNINVSYILDNGTAVTPEIIVQTLIPGDSLIYTFNATADLSSYGVHSIKAFVIEALDEDHNNDTIVKQIIASPLISTFPYLENFENSNGNWFTGGVNSTWQWGVPAGTVINTAGSGTKAWVTNLTGLYNDDENSYVVSPCFNFSSLTNPYVSLKRIVNAENSWDGASLQYSTDGGDSWNNVGSYNDPNNWYNDTTIYGLSYSGSQTGWTGTSTWVTSMHSLTALAGQSSVKFRIAFGSDGSNYVAYEGFGFDDFNIFEPVDLAIAYPYDSSTAYFCGLTNDEPVSIWIKNVASQPVNPGEEIPLWYQLNSNTPLADTLTLTNALQPGDSIQFTFAQHVDMSALTTYLFHYWIHYGTDYNTSNDSVLYTVVNYVLTVNITGGDTVCVDPIFLPYTLTLQNSSYTYDTYSWSNEAGTLTGTSSSFDAPAFGWYYVTVTHGACDASDSVFVCDQTNVEPLSYENISVYPSPAPVKLFIVANSIPQGDYILNLTTVDGRTISNQKFVHVNQINSEISTAQLPQGIYFLTLTNNNKTWKFKVVR